MTKRRNRIVIGEARLNVEDGFRRLGFLFRQFNTEAMLLVLADMWRSVDSVHDILTNRKPQNYGRDDLSTYPLYVGIRKLFYQYLEANLHIPDFISFLCQLLEFTIERNLVQIAHPEQMNAIQAIIKAPGSLDVEKYFLIDALVTGTVFAFIEKEKREEIFEEYYSQYRTRLNLPNIKRKEHLCPSQYNLTFWQTSTLTSYVPDFYNLRSASPEDLLQTLSNSLFYSEKQALQELAIAELDNEEILIQLTDKLIEHSNFYALIRGRKAAKAKLSDMPNIRYHDLLWGYGDPLLHDMPYHSVCMGHPIIHALIEAFSIALIEHQGKILEYYHQFYKVQA